MFILETEYLFTSTVILEVFPRTVTSTLFSPDSKLPLTEESVRLEFNTVLS
ncbi:MAG: hypothetical protein MJ091_05975 [Clostridia bacterium]|nr:hypothetical protein [Clostridia bacterium]